MRLRALTGLERERLKQEYEDTLKLIEKLKAILASEVLQMQIIKDELLEIKEKYGDEPKQILFILLQTLILKILFLMIIW